MMTTVKDIFDFIGTVAPSYMKESWDNVASPAVAWIRK